MNKKVCVFLAAFSYGILFAQENFLEGERLLSKNKCAEAAEKLTLAVQNNENPKAYVYLGTAYSMLGLYDKALEIFEQGMNVAGTDKKVLAYNAGNCCYVSGNFQKAEEWYSLSMSANSLYANPVLNRGNARLKQGKLLDSVADYKAYLNLRPDDEQKEKILNLISLIEGEIVLQKEQEEMEKARQEQIRLEEAKFAEERARQEAQAAAERAAMEEIMRQEQERLAKEAAERRRKLIEDVATSLSNTESQNMNAEAEGTVDYGYETELE